MGDFARGITHARTSRRAVAKGLVWAVPAVTIVSALPAMAVSGYYVRFTPIGIGCKASGSSCDKDYGITKGYFIQVEVCHNVPQEIRVDLSDATIWLNNVAAGTWDVRYRPPDPPPPAPPYPNGYYQDWLIMRGATAADVNGEVCDIVNFGVQGEPSSQNVSIWGKATYTWVTTATNDSIQGSGTIIMCAPNTPPCTNCTITPATNPQNICPLTPGSMP